MRPKVGCVILSPLEVHALHRAVAPLPTGDAYMVPVAPASAAADLQRSTSAGQTQFAFRTRVTCRQFMASSITSSQCIT